MGRLVKYFAGTLALFALSFGVAACGSSDNSSSTTASSTVASTSSNATVANSGSKVDLPVKTIGHLNVTRADPAAAAFEKSTEDAVKALGWKFVGVDAAGDPTKMAQGMQELVNQHVDAITSDAI